MTEPSRSTRWRSLDEPCRNCGDPTPGRFCPACGQRKVDVRVSLNVLLRDVAEDELMLSGATPRTIVALLFRPGLLTREYINGRMASYTPPLRLYLVASVLFFLLASFVGLRALERAATVERRVADADSARAALVAQRQQLQTVDTLPLPAVARAVTRQQLANIETALAALDRPSVTRGETAATPGPGATDAARPRADASSTGMQPWARELTGQIRSPWLQRAVDRKLAQVGHLTPAQALSAILADMLDYAPHMVFVLLPIFALLLKVLYAGRGRYYAEHFTFALHAHAFFFVMFIIMFILPWSGLNGMLMLWMGAYVWLAMKRVYGQGWARTTVKWGILGWSYLFILVFGLFGLMAVAVLV